MIWLAKREIQGSNPNLTPVSEEEWDVVDGHFERDALRLEQRKPADLGTSWGTNSGNKPGQQMEVGGGTTSALPSYFTYPDTHQNMALEGKEAPASGHGFCKDKRWGKRRTQSHIPRPICGQGSQGQENRVK